MVFKSLKCLIPSRRGVPCGEYLNVDIEAGVELTVQVRCRHRHATGHSNRLEFTQDAHGNISWREVPDSEKRQYDDNGIRIATG